MHKDWDEAKLIKWKLIDHLHIVHSSGDNLTLESRSIHLKAQQPIAILNNLAIMFSLIT